LKDGLETLVGHIDMHLFIFFVDSLGWPMMEYKVSPTNPIWSLLNAPPIRLWKTNPDGPPKLPTGVPSHVPYNLIWGNDVERSVERKVHKCRIFQIVRFLEGWNCTKFDI
jgi:hypothetical protein